MRNWQALCNRVSRFSSLDYIANAGDEINERSVGSSAWDSSCSSTCSSFDAADVASAYAIDPECRQRLREQYEHLVDSVGGLWLEFSDGAPLVSNATALLKSARRHLALPEFGLCMEAHAATSLRDGLAVLGALLGAYRAVLQTGDVDALHERADDLRTEAMKLQDDLGEVVIHAIANAEFTFKYKYREYEGRAVHVAALCQADVDLPAELMQRLMELRADIQLPCTSFANGSSQMLQPLHLAAGCGHSSVLAVLLEGGVNVNAGCKPESGQPAEPSSPELGTTAALWAMSTTALHEAVLFKHMDAVRLLLEHGAGVNAPSRDGRSPLHMAARQGCHKCAWELVQWRAALEQRDVRGRTPLETAITSGLFPTRKLHMLARKNIRELLFIAQESPSAAVDVMKHRSKDARLMVHKSWRQNLVNTVTVAQLVTLIRLTPETAEDILEAVTVPPEVLNKSMYPLPQLSMMGPGQLMSCVYRAEDKWEFHADRPDSTPSWHSKFSLETQSASSGVAGNVARAARVLVAAVLGGVLGARRPVLVQIKVVKLAGIVSTDVLYALKETRSLHIFTKLATQALIEHAWSSSVKWFYAVHILYRAVELCILVLWVFNRPGSEFFVRASWVFLSSHTCRDLWYELCELCGYVYLKKDLVFLLRAYVLNVMNAFDISAIALMMSLTVLTSGDCQLAGHPTLLALVAASRWVQFMYTLRVFPAVGEQLLPIMQALMPVGGILIITVLTFLMFLHAYFALESNAVAMASSVDTFMAAVRFLFLGDNADAVLNLGGALGPQGSQATRFFFIVGAALFNIHILNLFIAGTDQAYDRAQEFSRTSFLQERAAICLRCYLRPCLPCLPWGCRRWVAWLALVSLSAPVIGSMLLSAELHPVCTAALSFFVAILGDTILLHRRPSSDEKYLWICHRADYDEMQYWPSEQNERDSHLDGWVTVMKREEALRSERLNSELRALKRRVEALQGSVQQHLRAVSTRLSALERDCGARLGRIEQDIGFLVNAMVRGQYDSVQFPMQSPSASMSAPPRQISFGRRSLHVPPGE